MQQKLTMTEWVMAQGVHLDLSVTDNSPTGVSQTPVVKKGDAYLPSPGSRLLNYVHAMHILYVMTTAARSALSITGVQKAKASCTQQFVTASSLTALVWPPCWLALHWMQTTT